MKLVKIEDVRVGQIRKRYDGVIFVIEKKEDENVYGLEIQRNQKVLMYSLMPKYKESAMKRCELIGFIGITHEFKDNRLVEIPRDELQTDDIFTQFGEIFLILSTLENGNIKVLTPNCNNNNFYPKGKKIGILGVTHEFVNERLVK